MPPAPCTTCIDLMCAQLRTEAADLLKLADSNTRRGHRSNADWCRRAAFGYGRAIGLLRRKR